MPSMHVYKVTLDGIDHERLDELLRWIGMNWGGVEQVQIEAHEGEEIDGWVQQDGQWVETHPLPSAVGLAVPDPLPATSTGHIEVILPVEDPAADLLDDDRPRGSKKR